MVIEKFNKDFTLTNIIRLTDYYYSDLNESKVTHYATGKLTSRPEITTNNIYGEE